MTSHLPTWWQHHSIEIATRLIAGLYPRAVDATASASVAEHPAVVATQTWLDAHPQAPAASQRILVELLDGSRRALTVQVSAMARPAP